MATSTTSKALIAAAFVSGSVVTLTAKQLFGTAVAATTQFQNTHVWMARKNPDGGARPIYADRSCGYMHTPDGGVGQSVCSYDGEEMSDAAAASFESFLKARGIAPPR